MIASRLFRLCVFVLCLLTIVTVSFAQTQPGNKDYEPKFGQDGKDVIWIPTSQALVDKMLDMAEVTPQDYVIDLGSGDGRLVISAVKRGARGLGIEYNPDMVAFSKRNAAKEGLSDKAEFVNQDLFQSDFSKATVITMFLMPEINMSLRPRILNLKPGTRIVSNTFTMGDWIEDETAVVEEGAKCATYCTARLWVVPAKVEGMWKLQQGEITVKQSFQMISGTLKSGANSVPITNGRLRGDKISFTAGDVQYTGRVSGSTMQGTLRTGGITAEWSATRIGGLAQAQSE